MWIVKATCPCGCERIYEKDNIIGKVKSLRCECCGEFFKPVIFQYDIHVAIRGGISYVLEDLVYRVSYKKLEGLDQWINMIGVHDD